MQVAANDHKLARAFQLKLMCELRGHALLNFAMHTFTILYINCGHRKKNCSLKCSVLHEM